MRTYLLRAFAALLALPFIGALAYGSYQGLSTLGLISNPIYAAIFQNNGQVSQSNPLATANQVSPTIQWSSTAVGYASFSLTGGPATSFDLSSNDYQYAVVYMNATGTGGSYSYQTGDGIFGFTSLPARRNDCQIVTAVTYAGNFFVVPLRGRYFAIYTNALTGGTGSGTVYFTHTDPTLVSCNKTVSNMNAGQISVGTGASVQVAQLRQGVYGTGRAWLTLTNAGSGQVSCSIASGVTATTGFILMPGQETEPMPYDNVLYCISVTGTNIVSVREIY